MITLNEDPVRRVLDRLSDVKRHASSGKEYWTAKCPAHDDKKASLSIGQGRKGCVLKCHAGCSSDNIVRALGLELKDLFDQDRATFDWSRVDSNGDAKGNASSNGTGKIEAVYRYHDADWNLLYEAVRYRDPKDFKVRRPDGNGGYVWSLGNTPRVLFRLPQVNEAIQAGRTVFVVEGEKDADRLTAEELTATTCVTGAKAWRREYAEQLRGAIACILPDNDNAGRSFADDVCRSLVGVAAEIRVLSLDVPPKGDVSDWLDAGGTYEELVEAVYDAPKFDPDSRPAEEPVSENTQATSDDDDDEKKDGLPRATRLSEAPPPVPPDFAIEDFWTRNEIGFAAADGGVGKTSVAIAIGAAVAGGYEVFDAFEVRDPGPVLFVSEEDSLDVIHDRLEALCAGHGWDAPHVKENFHVLALEGASLDDDNWKLHLAAEMERTGAVLLILDPLADLTGAEKNEETRPIKRFLRAVARQTDAFVIICHHIGKVIEGKRKLDLIRGASAWVHGCRVIWFLEKHDVGVRFECLKLSRAKEPAPFVVTREVDVDGDNPASWARARLTVMSEPTANDMAADKYVLGRLREHEERNSTQLKDEAHAHGLDPVHVSGAVKRLHAGGRITFKNGPKNSKLWRLTATEEGDATR